LGTTLCQGTIIVTTTAVQSVHTGIHGSTVKFSPIPLNASGSSQIRHHSLVNRLLGNTVRNAWTPFVQFGRLGCINLFYEIKSALVTISCQTESVDFIVSQFRAVPEIVKKVGPFGWLDPLVRFDYSGEFIVTALRVILTTYLSLWLNRIFHLWQSRFGIN